MDLIAKSEIARQQESIDILKIQLKIVSKFSLIFYVYSKIINH